MQNLAGKRVVLSYPYCNDNKTKYWGQPVPDTIFIAHQALWAMKATVEIRDKDQCQKNILDGDRPDLVLELSGYGRSAGIDRLLGEICLANDVCYFPNNGIPQIIGADKLLSKKYAGQVGLDLPRTVPQIALPGTDGLLIQKPVYGGESVGVTLVENKEDASHCPPGFFLEEYIQGTDVTVLMVKNPQNNRFDILEAYESKTAVEQKFIDDATKHRDLMLFGDPARQRIACKEYLDDTTCEKLVAYAEALDVQNVCRIDLRKSDSKLHFLEINPDPTIGANAIWYDPLCRWGLQNGFDEIIEGTRTMPIHDAAKSMIILLSLYYV